MSFSHQWDKAYQNNTHMSVWPWSDLVSYTMRYAKPDKKDFKVLELGCGAGANIPFFLSLGVDYYAIEGSKSVIDMLKKKFSSIADKIVAGDFTKDIPFMEQFDLIVDRSSLTNNSTNSIKQCLTIVNGLLNKDGKFIGIDWFSILDSRLLDEKLEKIDSNSYKFAKGYFSNLGIVHFSDKEHLLDLFSKFKVEVMEHKVIKSEIPVGKTFALWNFVAKKI